MGLSIFVILPKLNTTDGTKSTKKIALFTVAVSIIAAVNYTKYLCLIQGLDFIHSNVTELMISYFQII